ncbi:MAG: choline dehydrogenase-like flavoprotein [Planctomycetota bacterium]
MIRDLDTTELEELPEYDLCIVGSGPAAGTLAAELATSGLAICVLESGKERVTRHGDRLREVRSEGIHIKEYSRERVLGGSSTTWAGLSSPLDAIDMEARPFLAHSGWPIERDELLPFWEAAADSYRFPHLDFFNGHADFDELKAKGDLRPEWRDVQEKLFLAAVEPQNFGVEIRDIYVDGAVDLWLDATVLRLECEPGNSRVDHALIRSCSGRQQKLKAKVFVLGTGGIENARLLLLSQNKCSEGLGNERDQVGRYLMNHPKNYNGILELAKPVEDLPYFFGCIYKGFAGYAGLRLPDEKQFEEEVMNSYVRFEPLFPWSDNDGIESMVLLAKKCKFIMKRFQKGKQDEVIDIRDYSETGDDSDFQNERKTTLGWIGLFVRILVNLPSVSQYLYFRLISRKKPLIKRVRLRNFMEMEPRPDNRVVLSEELDVNGTPLALVQHDSSERDRKSMVQLHAALGSECDRLDLGTLNTALKGESPWPITQDASHHMGSTRMGNDPSTSVVDANLKLHTADNLYITGASVFPTSGCANPTFTIVALSIRLARHLQQDVFVNSSARINS